jgi:hypothetical protein
VSATRKADRYVTEDVIERHLLREVKKLRGITFKMLFRRGWPDRLVLLPGRWMFIELKRPKGGRFEPLQLRTHARLRAQGYEVHVCYTKEQVDVVLSYL